LFQEPRIAVLIADMPPRLALGRLVVDVRRLGRLLGTFPRGPRLAFDPVDLLEFDLAGLVEIPHGRFPPVFANPHEVGRDGFLVEPHVVSDCLLRPALQVQVGYLLAAFQDGQVSDAAVRHLGFPIVRRLIE
jgi:hypothetical protein